MNDSNSEILRQIKNLRESVEGMLIAIIILNAVIALIVMMK